MCPANSAFKLEALVSARKSAQKEQTTINEAARIRAREIANRLEELRRIRDAQNS